jgi:uracil-DNA glycosylase
MQEINPKIEESWKQVLDGEFIAPYFADLKQFLINEKKRYTIYPPGDRIFSAFDLTPFHQVRVVILGQDPYHGPGQAHGLCFSVPEGIPKPPSLVNIFKELQDDLGIEPPEHGNLESWARQGVLLLNAILTVRAGQAGSHQGKGWERFTDAAVKALSDQRAGIVFLLWGNNAKTKSRLIDAGRHYLLTSPHPSPFSAERGFFGCRHFSKANELLIRSGNGPIDWEIK